MWEELAFHHTMPTTLPCPFPGCGENTTNDDKDLAITLFNAHVATHTVGGGPAIANICKPKVIDNPTVGVNTTAESWTYFTTAWDAYKNGTGLRAAQIPIHLINCCDPDLRQDVIRDKGKDIYNKTEAQILAAIRKLAVKDESVTVSRVNLWSMKQPPGSGVRTYAAALRGQANVCSFTLHCGGCDTDLSYMDTMIRDQICRGIADPEIQKQVLGEKDMELEALLDYISNKEKGVRSQQAVADEVNAARSEYQKSKHKSNPDADNSACRNCGKKGHGARPNQETRKEKCPAFDKTCDTCGKKGHFSVVCRGDGKKLEKPVDDSAAIFSSLCGISTTHPETADACTVGGVKWGTVRGRQGNIQKSIVLDNQVWKSDKGWIRRRASEQPTVNIHIEALIKDMKELGVPVQSTPKPHNTLALPDSGCQNMLVGIKTIYKMGLCKNDLVPVTLSMRSANEGDICLLGAILVRVWGRSDSGIIVETKQMCYVTDGIDRVFLNRDALLDMGIIPASFPTIGQFSSSPSGGWGGESRTNAITTEKITCACPRRSKPPPLPSSLPPGISATEIDREKLETWLKEYYSSSTFNVCEHQRLPLMTGEPLQLHTDPEAIPVAANKPIPIPIHWRAQVKADLDRDVALGVLEKVEVNTPVTWVSHMVLAAKHDGTARRTIDLQPLNKHAFRQTHHTEPPFHQAMLVPHHTKKTVCDCWNGFHSVAIKEEDRHKTTFITPFGRYRYLTTPQGFLASQDGFTQRHDEITSEFEDKVRCVDDTLLWSDDIEQAFHRTCQYLDLCGNNGIILHPKKFQFAKDTVEFAGLEITPENVRPSSKFLDAIRNFPTPTDITGARGWFGLVNQAAYAFSMTDDMLPFRHLLKPSPKFAWTADLETAFIKSKAHIVEQIEEGVRLFDLNRKTCLAPDWSQDGLGFFLLQQYCNCDSDSPICCKDGWKLVLAGSRFTHAAESRYCPIAGESLALVDALQKTKYFTLGCRDLIIATDHKPLLKVMGDRALVDIENPRLFNLKEKTLRFRFKLVHVPGKKHQGPDATSRNPVGEGERLHLQDDQPEQTAVCALLSGTDTGGLRKQILAAIRSHEEPGDIDCYNDLSTDLPPAAICVLESVKSVTWERVKEATASDPTMRGLLGFVEEGFPTNRSEIPDSIATYFQHRDKLSTTDGVVMYHDRLVIPPSLQHEVLQALHSAHQGESMMKARALNSVFWPGLVNDLSKTRSNCESCHKIAKSNPAAPPADPPQPEYPFQQISSDYFSYKGNNYIVTVDRFTGWPDVVRGDGGSDNLVTELRRLFVTFGIPKEISTDGGPQYKSDVTKQFLMNWGVRHRLSSVAFPHSNARAEIAVKTVKRMLMENTGPHGQLDTDKFQRAMLTYRNTPDPATHCSPAMALFGRAIRDFIPVERGKYMPSHIWSTAMQQRELALRHRWSLGREKWSEHTRLLHPLTVGDKVFLQNQTGNHPNRWERSGTIIEVKQHDQYAIKTDGSGRVTLRNRRFLRKFQPVQTSTTPRTPSSAQTSVPADFLPSPTGVTISPSAPAVPAAPATASPTTVMPESATPSRANDSKSSYPNTPLRPSPLSHTRRRILSPEPIAASTPHQEPETIMDHRKSPGITPVKSPASEETLNSPPRKQAQAMTRLLPHNQTGLQETLLPRSSRRACVGEGR